MELRTMPLLFLTPKTVDMMRGTKIARDRRVRSGACGQQEDDFETTTSERIERKLISNISSSYHIRLEGPL